MSIAPLSPARNAAVPSLIAVIALAMPKCPLCAIALLSALGIEARPGMPLTVALIVTPVLLIAWQRVSRAALLVATLGAVAALAGLFHLGVMAIFGAALWNAIVARRQCAACSGNCAPSAR